MSRRSIRCFEQGVLAEDPPFDRPDLRISRLTFHVGTRDAGCAYEFMSDLARRLRNRVQLTTDGHAAYLTAVDDAFGRAIDYSMLIKLYGEGENERRYSPPKCIGTPTHRIRGNP